MGWAVGASGPFSLPCLSSYPRSTHLLLDRDGIIVGVLLGMPKDVEGWRKALNKATVALQKAADKISARAKRTTHRRGTFPSLAHGISFGGGQKVSPCAVPCISALMRYQRPQFLKHASRTVARVLDELALDEAVQRVCKYASCK